MAKLRRRSLVWRRVETRLQIGQNRIECCTQRDQKAPRALTVAPAAEVALAKTRDDAAEVLSVATDIAALAKVFGARAGVAVEAAEHLGNVAIDMVEDGRCKRRALLPRQRDGRMDALIAP